MIMAKQKARKKIPLGKPILWSEMDEKIIDKLVTPDEADIELAASKVVRQLKPFMDAEIVQDEGIL